MRWWSNIFSAEQQAETVEDESDGAVTPELTIKEMPRILENPQHFKFDLPPLKDLMNRKDVIVLDCEPNGAKQDKRVIEMAIFDSSGELLFDEKFLPRKWYDDDASPELKKQGGNQASPVEEGRRSEIPRLL